MKCVASREKTVRRILSAFAATVVFGMIGIAYWSESTGGISLEHAVAQVEVAPKPVERAPGSYRAEKTPADHAPDSARERTYRQFSEFYGGESPLTESLFEWAMLGYRTDHGNPAYALERQRLLAQLGREPEATLALLRRGQGRLPAEWEGVRDSFAKLVELLDVSPAAKAELLGAAKRR